LKVAGRGKPPYFGRGFGEYAFMPEQIGERQKRAPWMIHPDEGRMSDNVERLCTAIFRMRAPADICQQTGGLPIARLNFGFVDAERGERFARPFDQFVGMLDRPPAQARKLL